MFYRPSFGPDGFGGTRYFPLHIVLHGALITVIGDPIRAGQFVALLSVTLLCAGVYAVVRALGGSLVLAVGSALAILASQTTQEALLSIKGDALPAALNLLGFALAIQPSATRRQTLGAAALFALAFTAKPTAIYGALAAVVWMAGSRQGSRALRLGFATDAIVVIALAAAALVSGGRVFSLWWEGGSSGLTLNAILRSPLTFAQLVRQVPETLVFVQLGIAAAVAIAMRLGKLQDQATLLMAMTLATTVPIFALEGTDTNHLVDVCAVSVVTVAAFIAVPSSGRAGPSAFARSASADFATATLAVATLAASLSLATGLVNRATEQRLGTFAQALALVPDRSKPILAENPLVSIASGQRPYLLDAYMFRIARESDPSFATPLWEALEKQAFSAVVLERNPHDERGRTWYASAFFGDGFIERLEASYEQAGAVGMRMVYRPRR